MELKRNNIFTFVFLLLMALTIPQQAMADEVQNTSRYRVLMVGIDKLQIEMPVYDEESYDGWVHDGKIFVTPEGGNQLTLLHYHSEEKKGADAKLYFYKCVDGQMVLTPGYYEDVEVTTAERSCRVPSRTNVFSVKILWTVPDNLRGKELTISWDVRKTGTGPNGFGGESGANVKPDPTTVTFPAVQESMNPTLMDPMLGYDATHAGQTMLVYMMSASNITSLSAHYTEVNGATETKKSRYLDPEMSGFIYLDADKCYKNFYIDARYKDSENKLHRVQSDTIIVPTLHQPYNLKATLQDNGEVELTWRCKNPGWADIQPDDMWEIQRNTSGNQNATAIWTSIGQISYEGAATNYSFTDATLLENYEGQPVYYRVRRTTTAIWDWITGTYAQTSLPFVLRLPTVEEATARKVQWQDDMHTASISFKLGAREQYDEQGRFMIRNEADWDAYVKLIEGQGNLSAVLTADLHLGKKNGMVSNRYYNGTFDGNGHTITLSLDTLDVPYVAPFSMTGGATIKNLHVTGRVVSSQKYASGLVGYAAGSGTLTISNCHVSALVGSTYAGACYNAGFVGLDDMQTKLTNCLFDGQLVGENSNSIRGFVGQLSYNGRPNLEKCVFNPSLINVETKQTNCYPFVEESNNTTLTNCYRSTDFGKPEKASIDGKDYYILRNADDWNNFLNKIVTANGNSDVNAIMVNDFEVTSSAGSRNNIPFRGIFEGNGRTLSVKIDGGDNDYVAPFAVTTTATIRNLNVCGSVRGGDYVAGMVGSSKSTLNIENCHVSAAIYTTKKHAGGFIGHSQSSTNAIRNSLFDGTITAREFQPESYAGAFRGWGSTSSVNTTTHCLENGTYVNFNYWALCYTTDFAYPSSGNRTNLSISGWNDTAVDASEMDLVALLNNLGSQWMGWGTLSVPKQTKRDLQQGTFTYDIDPVVLDSLLNKSNGAGQWQLAGNTSVPVMVTSDNDKHFTTIWDKSAKVVLHIDKSVGGTVRYTEQQMLSEEEMKDKKIVVELKTSCVGHDFRMVVDKGSSRLEPSDTIGAIAVKTEKGESARYEFNNNVVIDSLTATTQQSTVLLSWTTTGVGDFFRILRRDLTSDEWEVLETDYDMNTYLDRTPRPQHVYLYKVEGVNDCEGRHVSVDSIRGWCEPTGMVRGYVRLPDGTALGGVTVTAEPLSDDQGAVARSTETDNSGFFEIGGLIYTGAGSYEITASSKGNEGSYSKFIANFDDEKNLVTNAILIQSTYFLFQGYVMYEGTSVPVVGAQFERDGIVVKNGSGTPVITDSQGKFSVSIPKGDHTIRVVKDGHVFADEGFYLDENNNRKANWQKGVAEYVFWDQTKVTLQGRVVGGDVQGLKPLGQKLSVNNLGDSLTIVMQLEGDNASWLVRDQLNASITERHQDLYFGLNQLDTCHMDTYRHRLVIKPSAETGEYCVSMLPVKYKVTEIYGEGYNTLFQAGKVGETLDLTEYADKDVVFYSRIYHAVPKLSVRQFNMDGKPYMGVKQYTEKDNTGSDNKIDLWTADKGYAFGYPVYMAGSSIIMLMTAQEEYYYNNNTGTAAPDVVHLPGGEVTIQNALVGNDEFKTVKLDSLGEGIYRFTPQNLTFTQEEDMALKTLTMTLEYDNTHYDVLPMNGEPIRGYVMAAKAKKEGKQVIADGGTFLIDILRDPPGATSSAYIENGTKLNYSFSQDLKISLGMKLEIDKSVGKYEFFKGMWIGEGSGDFLGNPNDVNAKSYFNTTIATTYYNSWQYNYTFETTERISTSSSLTNVGADADVFIGMTQNAIMQEAVAVRVITDSTYQRLKTHEGGSFNVEKTEFKVPLGTLKVLAEGKNSDGKKVWLVRDEVLSVGTSLKSTFVHSAKYIEKELMPELFKLRNALLLDVQTSSDKAQAIADNTGRTVYVSKVPFDDDNFGFKNYYTQYDPAGKELPDSVDIYNQRIITWYEFLAINEKEKLEAHDLVKRYDVDGRATVNYSESFTLNDTEKRYYQFPLIGTGLGNLNFKNFSTASSPTNEKQLLEDDINYYATTVKLFKEEYFIKYQPIFTFDYNYNYGQQTTQTKKIGFTLAPSGRSNLLVDVYRTKMSSYEDEIKEAEKAGYDEDDLDAIFFQRPSEEYISDVKHGDGYGVVGSFGGMASYAIGKYVPQYRSFVYRTRGGATCEPYEDERKTKYYASGMTLDAKTIEIDHPRIWVDQSSVSNVPADEPARFTLHFVNESPLPAQATKTNPFLIYLAASTNPNGAKVYVDGFPLAGGGLSLLLDPNVVVTKTVEVYPGTEYDYEDIQLGIKDPLDVNRSWDCNISAHFVPVAGKVNISLPGDKWVVNTESAYDSKRQQYYMPVRIDGFDVNFRNFDHIELQYKLSTQGDKDWVNVCSFYNDSLLMAKATGERRLIEDDGRIMATFWGETDPIEQTYDLRAVNYCRYGNGFLTRSSEILTGIKDTRRPQLFGTPKPEDGILDIGEDIVLRFSEPIAGNYLRGLNNFQVLGQTNSSNIALSTDLRFNGEGRVYYLGTRNLSGRAFTVDMMINPDDNNKDMTLFSHGDSDNFLELGVSRNGQLAAVFKDATFLSNAIDFSGLRQVSFVIQPDINTQTTQVSFYDGTNPIGSFNYNHLYNGTGSYSLGVTSQYEYDNSDVSQDWEGTNYEGEMLEFRLWNRALSIGEMNEYAQKRLTGYELGLLDNFPLNEGQGDYSFNRVVSGSDLSVNEAAWNVPDGIGMKLDGKEGFRIESDKFSRTNYQDYTMMFWFRTTDYEGTLLSNGQAETEAEATNHFNFGVHGGSLDLRLGGRDLQTHTSVNDGAWHHVALTVNRSRNVGNLYVDQLLKKTFAVDTLGGIQGSRLAAGVTMIDSKTVERPITGSIDEIAMYEMALSENIIKATSSMTLSGEELGLMAYLSFGRNELQQNNQQKLVPTGISLKRYRDLTTGELTTQRDTLVAQDVVERLADKSNYAPMRGVVALENIPYSFVAKDNELYIDLDMPDYQIEKTNVLVTVKEVADLNGNTMASPVTMDLYVYRNPLRWTAKQLTMQTRYGEEYTFEAVIENLSGKSKRFSLEGLPIWITASQYKGVVGPLSEQPITFTISPYINIGDFDEVIYLIGEDEMNEPLPLNIKVRGEAPVWAVDSLLLQENVSMSIIGQVYINDNISHDKEDMLAAFNSEHRLLGVTHLDYDATGTGNDGLAYLTVYNTDRTPVDLFFEFYDASTGIIHKLMPKLTDGSRLVFKSETVIGSITDPQLFFTNNQVVQTIQLQKGWNWVSFHVTPREMMIKDLLNNATNWEVGDGVEADTSDGNQYLITYKSEEVNIDKYTKGVNYLWDYGDSIISFDSRLMYRIFSKSNKQAYVEGYYCPEGITVRKGWNRIGYVSDLNLPIGTAMSVYADLGSNGDIIKSQSEFAVLSVDAFGNKQWKGTLKYLRVGEGYMLKRNDDSEVTFYYPAYTSNIRYGGDSYTKRAEPAFQNNSGTSMTVVAMAEGVDVEFGDRLTVYQGAEVCGVAVADEQGVFYLNVGAHQPNEAEDKLGTDESLTFMLERGEEVVAVTNRSQMRFVPNASHGTPDEPTAINFANADAFDYDGWYTLNGIKLSKRPQQRGVYIHNNEKFIIK
ncbi:MAG: hypothetical protein IKN83_08885 [Bacteroidaceae bacterium]|nr:hypothetical protein [Bacteroidaceae bacterium]